MSQAPTSQSWIKTSQPHLPLQIRANEAFSNVAIDTCLSNSTFTLIP